MQNLNDTNKFWRELAFSRPYGIYSIGIEDKNGEAICELSRLPHCIVEERINKRQKIMNEVSLYTPRAYIQIAISDEGKKIEERNLRKIMARPETEYI